MAAQWEKYLELWTRAGLIEPSAAERVRAYEADQEKLHGFRWPVMVAIALGGLLLAAGILLFVAAHWSVLSPLQRFATVVMAVAVVHGAGAIASMRFKALSTTLHAVGPICLGAGIFLTAQIFHLQEHWPGGIMLWAMGAWAAWAFLRDWPQAVLAAVLTPAWLASEWLVATKNMAGSEAVLAAGFLMLAITYLTAVTSENASAVRKALSWIGGLTIIPAVIVLILHAEEIHRGSPMPYRYHAFGWAAAFLLPTLLAWGFRGKSAFMNLAAAFWAASLSAACSRARWLYGAHYAEYHELLIFGLCALGAVGLITWGMMEGRKERVNLGIAGFALTVLFFYFSNLMDKLGRSASLIGLGILFLLGGWGLERIRRRLLVKIEEVRV
ncbi:MAG: DUF2157 domain-containing protein [Desulfomonilia bacterium]